MGVGHTVWLSLIRSNTYTDTHTQTDTHKQIHRYTDAVSVSVTVGACSSISFPEYPIFHPKKFYPLSPGAFKSGGICDILIILTKYAMM